MDAGVKDKDAKGTLITLLNEPTMRGLDQHISLRGEVDSTDLMAKLRLDKVPYKQIVTYLKQGNLSELAHQGAGATTSGAISPKPSWKVNKVGGFGYISIN